MPDVHQWLTSTSIYDHITSLLKERLFKKFAFISKNCTQKDLTATELFLILSALQRVYTTPVTTCEATCPCFSQHPPSGRIWIGPPLVWVVMTTYFSSQGIMLDQNSAAAQRLLWIILWLGATSREFPLTPDAPEFDKNMFEATQQSEELLLWVMPFHRGYMLNQKIKLMGCIVSLELLRRCMSR